MEENASPIRNLPLLKSKMFPSPGRPARTVCCFREPAGTINSHLKKFPHHILETVQAQYVAQMQRYKSISGELFEYHEHLTVDDYREFLTPLILPDELAPFVYKGNQDQAHVTPPMEEVYEQMRQLMARQSPIGLGRFY